MEMLDPNAWSGTLAAMYLLLLSEVRTSSRPHAYCWEANIFQGWMRILNTSGAHGFAMSHLLQLAESHRWRGGFEEELVLAACMSIVSHITSLAASILTPRLLDCGVVRQPADPTWSLVFCPSEQVWQVWPIFAYGNNSRSWTNAEAHILTERQHPRDQSTLPTHPS